MVIVFDTGPIISLASNNLLWILKELRKQYNDDFYITEKVKYELIDRPLQTKKFRFEAIQILPLISDKILKVYSSKSLHDKTNQILNLANETFKAKSNFIKVVHPAEVEVLAAAIELDADAVVIDETTTRYLVEKPLKIIDRFERKLHSKVIVNSNNIKYFKDMFKSFHVIRSFELAIISYELGLFSKYVDVRYGIPELKEKLLSGILWALKLNGCSVRPRDIDFVLGIEKV